MLLPKDSPVLGQNDWAKDVGELSDMSQRHVGLAANDLEELGVTHLELPRQLLPRQIATVATVSVRDTRISCWIRAALRSTCSSRGRGRTGLRPGGRLGRRWAAARRGALGRLSAVLWAGAVAHEGTPWRLAVLHGGDWLLKLLVVVAIAGGWPW
jgi:hypothetical protein